MHHQAVAVVALGQRRTLRTEIQLAVHVILDQGHLVCRQQRHQRALFLGRHQAAQRILETRHQPACLGAVPLQHFGQRRQVDAVARKGGQLDRLQLQPLQRLQARIETGRLDQHHIAGPRHRLQAQVERLQRAVGDDDVVAGHGHAIQLVAQRDLAPQLRVPRRQVDHRAPRIDAAQAARGGARQLLQGEQQGAGEGRAEGHDIARPSGGQHVEHQLTHIDGGGSAAGARCLRLLRTRAGGRANIAVATAIAVRAAGQSASRTIRRSPVHGMGHVITGTGPRHDGAPRLQQIVSLEHGGRADAAPRTLLAHGRQALAGTQQAAGDHALDFIGQRLVQLQASPMVN